jgi:hypothetical protein
MLDRLRANYANVAASLALIAALGGSAIAATSAENSNQVVACAAKKGKKKNLLRFSSTGKCKKKETLVAWNKVGPAGAAGAAGAPGTPGAAGQRGPTGPVGDSGQRGPTGDSGPKGDQGLQGLQGIQGVPGTNGVDAVAPPNAVMTFNRATCPNGWTEFTAAQGRYIVGLPTGGTLGGTDGTALSNLEDRPTGKHNHSVNDPGHSHAIDANAILFGGNVTPSRVMGTTNQGAFTTNTLAGAAQTATTGISLSPAGLVDGTNAPYVQLLVCEKS